MNEMVAIAHQIIQVCFNKESSNDPKGTTKLTHVSMFIGEKVALFMDREPPPLPWHLRIKLGDLFIEAFFKLGYILIEYPKTFDSSYIIKASITWTDLEPSRKQLLKGTVFKPISPITQMMQREDQPVIKDRNEDEYIDINAPYIKAINNLQSVGWKINERLARIVEKNKDLFVSEIPVGDDNDLLELRRRSKLSDWNFTFAKVNKILDQSDNKFYQYIDADYRGRVYYMEPFLNYQSHDIARGLLLFDYGKVLDETGLKWLAIYTACSYNMSYHKDNIPDWCEVDYKSYLEEEGLESISVDKFTIADRIRWVNRYMDTLLYIGKRGWILPSAEKSVSFLAACIEWYNDSQSEEEYYCCLPVSIDGSNNGWQHLGAISKDRKTGELVGLIPSEIQHDFYVKTAKELHHLTTDERRLSILNEMPMKDIRKGISKRGSMTRAYSAGAEKIATNMWLDCRAEEFDKKYGITDSDCIGFAKDLVDAIDKVCPGPLQTMGYLQEIALYNIGKTGKFIGNDQLDKEYDKLNKERKEVAYIKEKTDKDRKLLNDLVKQLKQFDTRLVYGRGNKNIKWSTPSGFFVIYNNPLMKRYTTRGRINGVGEHLKQTTDQIRHVANLPLDFPDVKGYMCGISPNYIHSMDAAHMALIVSNWNGYFGAVHDSYAVHACDVENLLTLTKQTFIEMYNVDNFFHKMRRELTDKNIDVDPPELGDLDIREVKYSDYFFA